MLSRRVSSWWGSTLRLQLRFAQLTSARVGGCSIRRSWAVSIWREQSPCLFVGGTDGPHFLIWCTQESPLYLTRLWGAPAGNGVYWVPRPPCENWGVRSPNQQPYHQIKEPTVPSSPSCMVGGWRFSYSAWYSPIQLLLETDWAWCTKG